MSRTPTWGSGSRSRRPLPAPSSWRGVLRVLVPAAAVAALALALHSLGGPSALSPGRLSAAHAAATPRCGDCHSGATPDAGCARCHAAGEGQRFAARAHAPEAPGDCATCHAEHAGPAAAVVADERCAGCHFASLDAHLPPLPRPQVPRERGLRFGHARHLEELSREGRLGEAACEVCHGGRERLARPGFAACAGCHAPEGPLGLVSVARREVALPRELEAAGIELATATQVELDGERLHAEVGHRDPWLILNLERAVARRAESTALALAGPCLRCHPGAVHGLLAPAGAARSPAARFDHARHAQPCGQCHRGVEAAQSLPLGRPDPASCLDCHRDGDAPRACAACHRFHPEGQP
jgi:predicted CXXCH cytochrome family protein